MCKGDGIHHPGLFTLDKKNGSLSGAMATTGNYSAWLVAVRIVSPDYANFKLDVAEIQLKNTVLIQRFDFEVVNSRNNDCVGTNAINTCPVRVVTALGADNCTAFQLALAPPPKTSFDGSVYLPIQESSTTTKVDVGTSFVIAPPKVTNGTRCSSRSEPSCLKSLQFQYTFVSVDGKKQPPVVNIDSNTGSVRGSFSSDDNGVYKLVVSAKDTLGVLAVALEINL